MLLALTGLVVAVRFPRAAAPIRQPARCDIRAGLGNRRAAAALSSRCKSCRLRFCLGGILCFWRLTRSSELIVARAAGVSAWEFLTAPTFCALLFGAAAVTVGSPLSSSCSRAPKRWTTPICNAGGGPLALDGGQLWLRQSDRALTPQGVAIIHARDVATARQATDSRTVSACSAWTATIGCWHESRRRRAVLDAGSWELVGARNLRPDEAPGPVQTNQPADRPDGAARAGELRLARHAVGLGAARASSHCCDVGLFQPSATACIFNRCSHCRCCARRWHWSAPDSRCVRRGAAASRA